MKIIFSIWFQTYIQHPTPTHHREIVLQREKLRLSKNVDSSCLHLKAVRNLGQLT